MSRAPPHCVLALSFVFYAVPVAGAATGASLSSGGTTPGVCVVGPRAPILRVVVHRVHGQPLGSSKRHLRLIWRQERLAKSVAPIHREAWAANLNPRFNIRERGQFGWKYLGEEDGNKWQPAPTEHCMQVAQDGRGTLTAERSQDNAPALGRGGGEHSVTTERMHASVLVDLVGEDLGVRVVSAGWTRRGERA
eukprot:scaffold159467_cov27-Tisochrysis_lutea.AAC.3